MVVGRKRMTRCSRPKAREEGTRGVGHLRPWGTGRCGKSVLHLLPLAFPAWKIANAWTLNRNSEEWREAAESGRMLTHTITERATLLYEVVFSSFSTAMWGYITLSWGRPCAFQDVEPHLWPLTTEAHSDPLTTKNVLRDCQTSPWGQNCPSVGITPLNTYFFTLRGLKIRSM